MSYLKPNNMGIIACPGGEVFADEIISFLKFTYSRKFEKQVSSLSEIYDIEKTEVVRKINFFLDTEVFKKEKIRDSAGFSSPLLKLPVRFTHFANGEFKAEILKSVRGMDIFVIQDVENRYPLSFCGDHDKKLSVNDHVMCLFVVIDAALQAGARSVSIVIPTYPFARQHKKKGREALTASWFGRVLEFSGVARIITLDIHSKEIENTFRNLRLENLHASYQIIRKLTELIDLKSEDIVVVSPDTGAVDRNKFYAGNLQSPLAVLYKERDYSRVSRNARENNITNVRLLGSVKGKTVFMADDLLGTGGTLIKAIRFLRDQGANKIICAISLPLFSGDAVRYFDEAFKEGLFFRIIGTNAVYHGEELLKKEWYESVSISNLFARIIAHLHHNRSLSSLLDNRKIIQRLLKQ